MLLLHVDRLLALFNACVVREHTQDESEIGCTSNVFNPSNIE